MAHITIDNMCVTFCISEGSIFRTSLMTPSGPGDLLFFSELMQSWKAAWSIMELCSHCLSELPSFSDLVILDFKVKGSAVPLFALSSHG